MKALSAWLRIILSTVALVALFAVALATLYRFDLRLDLTSERRYSLSRHAQQLLETLEADVEITAFLRSQNPRNPYIRDLLRRVDNASARVRWEEVDVNRSPAKAHQHGVTSYGAVVVRSGGRERVLPNPREQSLMWAILQVTRDEPKTVYFVTGHGERAPGERDRLRGYSDAAARVREELYEVRVLGLRRVDEIPADATVLVLAGPQAPLAGREIALLDAYLARGGRVLVLLDAVEDAGLAPTLSRYGIAAPRQTIVDPQHRMFGGEFVTIQVPTDATEHPIAAGLGAPPVLSLVRPVEAGLVPPGIDIAPVLRTGPESWATPDRDVLRQEVPRFVAERDRRGPLSVGVEVRLQERGGRQGRLIVYGNAEFASNFFLDREGNADLLLNTINWLADEPALIAPRAPRKEPGTEQLLVLGQQGAAIFWIAVVVLPGAFLLLGVGQFWRQRYAR
jgi:ABC-type uncharacterized transport system involved in gliding motility auxiliary subunit